MSKKSILSTFIAGIISFSVFSINSPAMANENNFNQENIKISSNYFDSTQSNLEFNLKMGDNKKSENTRVTVFGLPQNMGPIDRSLRVLVALGLIGTGVYGVTTNNLNPTLSYTLMGVSVIPIATAATGYCPIYQLFGLEYSF